MNSFYSLGVSTPGSFHIISYNLDLDEAKQMAKKFLKHLGEKNMQETQSEDCVVMWKNDHFAVFIELETFGEIKGGDFPW